MKGKLLRPEQGTITHSVFGASQADADGDDAGNDEDGDGSGDGSGQGSKAKKNGDPNDILNTFKHVYVKEVVREPKIHFYRVPRLGSFLVVPLEYNSCLSGAALDASVADTIALKKAREDQDKERAEWDEEQAQAREEKERAGEPFEPDTTKVWDALEEKPFISKKKSFAICLDTLGQDREFTDAQRRFVLNTVR